MTFNTGDGVGARWLFIPATALANEITCSSVWRKREATQNTCLQFPLFWKEDSACSWAPHRVNTEMIAQFTH